MTMTTIAILCVGDELLDGRISDQNARHLTAASQNRPWKIVEIRTVGDDQQQICDALRALGAAQVVVVSGGLGPTDDDVTRRAAARFGGVNLVEDPSVLKQLKRRFVDRKRTFSENNRRQAQFPQHCTILPTEVGTAAGFRMKRDDTDYYFFPGVPSEFRWFTDTYLPGSTEANQQYRKRLFFFGRGESDLESALGDIPRRAEEQGIKIGFRADLPLLEIALSGDDEDDGRYLERRIRATIGPWLVAEDDESFSARTGRRLIEDSATVCVAESCTAGLLGAKLTEASGSSRYFEEGYLTYANRAKERLLGVDTDILESHGAVSPQVAAQMALGARERSGATYALAVSGIAGPTGGTPQKPVGTVDFALATPEGVLVRRDHYLGRNRHQVRLLSVHRALALLLWRLEDRLIGEHRVYGPFDDDEVRQGIDVDVTSH